MQETKNINSIARSFVSNTIKSILRFSIPVNKLTKPVFKALYGLHVFMRELLIWLSKSLYFDPLFKSQCVHVGKGLWMEKMPYIVGNGEIYIGDSVRLSGKPSVAFSTKINPKPCLKIGNNTFIGHGTGFAIADRAEIGMNCLISGGVSIMDNDGHPLDYIKRRNNLPPDRDRVKPVVVGNDVWIGRGAVIAKGVNIGDRSVIGARAVVTKDVLADCVVAGNPAKIIKILSQRTENAGQ